MGKLLRNLSRKTNKATFYPLKTSDFFLNDLVTIKKEKVVPKDGAVWKLNDDEDFPKVGEVASSKPIPVHGSNSFTGLFRENRTISKGMPIEVFDCNDGDVVLEKEDCMPIQDKWGFCLVGCFTGRFPGGKAVHDLKDSWGVACKVIPHTKYWTIFKFKSFEDREKVFEGGPYSTWGKTLMLKKVDDGTIFDENLFLDIPIWVKFFDVPLNFWNPRGLGKIASKLGKPLFSDQVTNECTSAKYARILVEVDMRKELLFDFVVKTPWGSYIQKVCYENCPEYCFRCKKFGHFWDECEKLGGNRKQDEVVDGDTNSSLELSTSDVQNPNDNEEIEAQLTISKTSPALSQGTAPTLSVIPIAPVFEDSSAEEMEVGCDHIDSTKTSNSPDTVARDFDEQAEWHVADPNFIEVWIKFFDVPLRYYSCSGLSKIASKLGSPLQTDEATAEFLNLGYARILVLIDVRKEPILEFKVNLPRGKFYIQRVEYEDYVA